MDYEKKYEQALKRAKEIYNRPDATDGGKIILESMFSELRESEDERIRKEITEYITRYKDCITDKEYNSWISWLERQGEQNQKHFELKAGHWYICHRAYCCRADHLTVKEGERFMCEKDGVVKGFVFKEPEKYFKEVCAPAPMEDEQKPADEVESKFKVGDWITNGEYTWKVTDIKPLDYLLQAQNGDVVCDTISYVDEEFHLWTIDDAKDGDVLAAHECLVLFKKIDVLNIRCYCTYHFMNNQSFYVDTLQNKDAFHPAIKEQCDILFKKMKEEGYVWYAEKKELIKIEQKFDSCSENVQKNRQEIERKIEICEKYSRLNLTEETSIGNHAQLLELCEIKDFIDFLLQESSWSEEDEKFINYAISLTDDAQIKNFLKSLKYRVQPQPKKEWSEEDEKMLISALWHVSNSASNGKSTDYQCEVTDWLKSLKPRWKPSEEQMEAFAIAVHDAHEHSYYKNLFSLYNDLKGFNLC